MEPLPDLKEICNLTPHPLAQNAISSHYIDVCAVVMEDKDSSNTHPRKLILGK